MYITAYYDFGSYDVIIGSLVILITRSNKVGPLEFELTRVTCTEKNSILSFQEEARDDTSEEASKD